MNYFDILNVAENAEDEVIRASYKALAKKYHPDNTELPIDIAEKKMQEINEAYHVLSDKEAKRRYLDSLHKTEERKEKEKEETTYYPVQQEEGDAAESITQLVMIAIIMISVICCLIYYGPGLLKDTWYSIQSDLEEVLSTF